MTDCAITPVKTESILDEQNHLEVFNYLEGLSPKWRHIGFKLGIPLEALDGIETTESDLNNKLMRMTSDWLKRKYDDNRWGPPTWSKLASVVEGINRNIAQNIRGDHCAPRTTHANMSAITTQAEGQRCTRGTDSNDDLSDAGCCCCCWSSRSRGPEKSFKRNGTMRRSSTSSQSAQVRPVTNPTALVNFHTSYHGYLTGAEAEQKLRSEVCGHCYLTRYSRRRRSYSLSIKYTVAAELDFMHMKIVVRNGKFWLHFEAIKVEFDSLESLLYHYQENPINPEIFSIGIECKSEDFVQQQLESRGGV